MKTKLCRPVLVEDKKIHQDFPQNEYRDYLSLFIPKHPGASPTLSLCRQTNFTNKINPQQLILVSLDPDEKIEVGDKIYSVLYGLGEIVRDYGGIDSERNRPLIAKFENSTTQQSYHRNGIWQKGKYEDVSANNCKKIIAQQSQLSPEYIQQFIEEYNKGEVKDVEND